MKKTYLIMSAVALSLGLTACGKKEAPPAPAPAPAAQPAPMPAPAPAPANGTMAPTTNNTAPANGGMPAEQPAAPAQESK